MLREARERLEMSRARNRQARRAFEETLADDTTPDWFRLLDESARLRSKKPLKTAELAIRVAAKSAENEERRNELLRQCPPNVKPPREVLSQLHDQIHCSMVTAIDQAQTKVRRIRLYWTLVAMESHALNVVAPRSRPARGVGKIGGLPLPHAGPELYSVLPVQELTSALRLVASLTYSVATCLGIRLPHPIGLKPGKVPTDIGGKEYWQASSQFSALSLAKSPVLYEAKDGEAFGLGNPAEEAFAIGLQLLGHDIVHMAMQAGVSVDNLWPPESLLLNLHALQLHCYQELTTSEPAVLDEEKPKPSEDS